MIRIRSLTTDKWLDLTPGQQVSFVIENPMFSDDRMTVPVSTGLKFLLTPTNMAEFGFVDALMISPRVTLLTAAVVLGGLEIFRGTLTFDEFSDGALHYTFVQTTAADQMNLTGKIHELTSEVYDGIAYADFIANARAEAYPDFGLPMIIRKPNVAKVEYLTPNAGRECSVIDKYVNHLYQTVPYFIPAVRLSYLLNRILPVDSFPADVAPYLQRMAIMGLHKPDAWQNDRFGLPLRRESGRDTVGTCDRVRVTDSLPDMACTDLVGNILKMFCASIFPGGTIMTNKSVISNISFADWSERVSNIYSVIVGEVAGYSLSYTNENEDFTPSKEENTGQSEVADSIMEAANFSELQTILLAADDFITVRRTDTNNIYSGRRVDARLNYSGQYPSDKITPIATMDIVHLAGLDRVSISNDSESSSPAIDIGFQCVRCIPASVSAFQGFVTAETRWRPGFPFPRMGSTPIVDFPGVDSNRPTDAHVGLLYGTNMLDRGDWFADHTPTGENDFTLSTAPLSIAIGGADGLWERFHRAYAEWAVRRRDSVRAEVFLEPADVAGLKLWEKKMIRNRLFFVKSMELTISDNADFAIAHTEFIDATV